MAVVLTGVPFIPVEVKGPGHDKDEDLPISGDSSNYSEDEIIAKAARFDEAEGQSWDGRSSWAEGVPVLGPAPVAPLAPCPSGVWTTQDSAALYGVQGWGEGYFEVNSAGHIVVKPKSTIEVVSFPGVSSAMNTMNATTSMKDGKAKSSPTLDLHELVNELVTTRGLTTPMILRFPDILGDRICRLNSAFARAIHCQGYLGAYQGVFPVKCNHDRDVVSSVVEFGAPFSFGLEVGSKAELVLAAAALCSAAGGEAPTPPPSATRPPSLLVCNGYKDAEYMEMALRCGQLLEACAVKVIIVMEQPEEVAIAVTLSNLIPTSPTLLGLRAKLSTAHGGHWGCTSGESAKFGLSPRQMVQAFRTLDASGLIPRLALVHFHVGSQMSTLDSVQDALTEGAALYASLRSMGAAWLCYLDVGGGLAIDYDGSGTDAHTSRAYCVEGYADVVVRCVAEACNAKGVPHPVIVSESGRALASHHSVVIFDVLDGGEGGTIDDGNEKEKNVFEAQNVFQAIPTCPRTPQADYFLNALTTLHSTECALQGGSPSRERVESAEALKAEALRAFKLGSLTLEERVCIEELVHAIKDRAMSAFTSEQPSKQVHINLSVFRTAVDCWAIGQVFPILPLSRLDEYPTGRAVFADLTCDSDGKLDTFINPTGGPALKALPIHTNYGTAGGTAGGDPYRLAMFLTGVYQETMGSPHNLYGSLNSVTIRLRPRSMSCTYSNHHPIPSYPLDVLFGTGWKECDSEKSDDDSFPIQDPEPDLDFVIDRIVHGESVAGVLSRAGHDIEELISKIRSAHINSTLGGETRDAVAFVESRIGGYTYMRS
jgi:arginine decarboxylase